ncbi:MAG: SusD/RagB family nutrient-binding outer membrane lipoprotein, partial [Alistipes sp.]
TPYRGIINGTDDEVALAFAKVLRVAIMQRVTDSYGPIPYSELENNESITVKYDSQEAVYTRMLAQLDEALVLFGRNLSLPVEAWNRYDAVYFGNIAQWVKYTNSLKLRMAMRLSEVKPEIARAKAAEAIAAGVITAVEDNAQLQNYRQMTVNNPLEMLWNSYNDARMSASMDSYLNGYGDPRLSKMFKAAADGSFHGVRNGLGATDQKFYTELSAPNIAANTPMRWLMASEVAFLKAEVELSKNNASGAEANYKDGIRLSFVENGLSDGEAATYAEKTTTPASFTDASSQPGNPGSTRALGKVTVKWNNDGSELERIITQKWIALYPNGMEAWAEFRRTGFPRLFPIVADSQDPSVNKNTQIRRMVFPKAEYANNAGAVNAATRLLGGADRGGTKLWWDKK